MTAKKAPRSKAPKASGAAASLEELDGPTGAIWEWFGDDLYKVVSMRYSSERYGACEVCRKHVAEVFLQVHFSRRKFTPPDEILATLTEEYKAAHPDWECILVSDIFGHEECLRSSRKPYRGLVAFRFGAPEDPPYFGKPERREDHVPRRRVHAFRLALRFPGRSFSYMNTDGETHAITAYRSERRDRAHNGATEVISWPDGVITSRYSYGAYQAERQAGLVEQ